MLSNINFVKSLMHSANSNLLTILNLFPPLHSQNTLQNKKGIHWTEGSAPSEHTFWYLVVAVFLSVIHPREIPCV